MNSDMEQDYSSLTSVLLFAFEQMMKGIDTCLPGVVESYNPTTKRARVKPALRLLTTEGLSIEQAAIVNVPVLFPSFGGFTILGSLKPDDAVLLQFSQRGLSKFKQGFGVADPDDTSFFSRQDAVAIPGFGAMSVVPMTQDGISIQTEDGTQSIVVENGKIKITSATMVEVVAPVAKVTAATSAAVTSPAVSLSGAVTVTGSLVVNGIPFSTHVHAYPDPNRGGFTLLPSV